MTAKRKHPPIGPAAPLAEAVERRREELGLSWAQVREQFDIVQSVVNRWKTNPRPPQLARTGHRVATFLDVSFDEVRRLAGATNAPKARHLSDAEIQQLIDEADEHGWSVIKSRVQRRMLREDTDR